MIPTSRADQLCTIGRLLHGDRYQSQLAAALGISDRTMRRYVARQDEPSYGLLLEAYGLLTQRIEDIFAAYIPDQVAGESVHEAVGDILDHLSNVVADKGWRPEDFSDALLSAAISEMTVLGDHGAAAKRLRELADAIDRGNLS